MSPCSQGHINASIHQYAGRPRTRKIDGTPGKDEKLSRT
jgi:hypothetical protein